MIMKIENIWNELEADKSLYSGLLYRRFSSKVKPDIFVALKSREKLRALAVSICAAIDSYEYRSFDKFRDIKIETLQDEKDPAKHFLLIVLLNKDYKDVFSALCENLILQVSKIENEVLLIVRLLQSLEKWRLMFEKMRQQGLSEEAQRGLYGELYFLRKILTNFDRHHFWISTWKGPEKDIQDFQYADWALEVKTTYGKNHQKIQIANERQLDTKLVKNIFIFHLSLDVRIHNGETLNDIIDEIKELISSDPPASNEFGIKLLEADFFDAHRELYNENGYSIRNESIYRVTDDFPKITESQLPKGVGDLHYSIIISNNSWSVDEEQLFSEIKTH